VVFLIYVFIGCLAFGALYSLVAALLGGHGFDHGSFDHAGFDHSGFDHSVDHGAPDSQHSGSESNSGPSPFNPIVIASAITAFGAVGLIAKTGFGMGDLLSTVLALGFAGITGTLIFFGIVKFMYGSQSNSLFSLQDLINTEAEVLTPIPANGTGEVAYVQNGIRYNISAKSVRHEEISRGSIVVIKDIAANAAMVIKKVTLDELEIENQ
jgi:hypothetical protein